MKSPRTLTIDDDLWEKAVVEAKRTGQSVSKLVEIGLMSVVDKKALLRHTGGLFKQLAMIMGENVKKHEIQGDLIKE
jgi:hypothetical protein